MKEGDLNPWRDSTDLLKALEEARQLDRKDLREAVIALADHDSQIVREEALSLLLSAWREPRAREIALRILRSPDEDFGVRTRAAVGLAAVSAGKTRVEDTRVLLDRVLDHEEDPSVRRAAYEALCLMYKRPIPPVNRPFAVEHDADQEWLSSLRRQVALP